LKRALVMPVIDTLEPSSVRTIRYCGYLIRYTGQSYTITLAGDEVMHQPYPEAWQKMGADGVGAWMLEQAKAFVDARRAGHV
jgi:hypothetical protein